MYLIDSHCHIHSQNFPLDKAEVFAKMHQAGVKKAICIGVNYEDSVRAVKFAQENSGEPSGGLEFFACVGVHPHDAKTWSEQTASKIKRLAGEPRVVAIGEIGLDYHYDFSPRDQQKNALRQQLKIAADLELPVVFHLRESYDDFWEIFDNFVAQHGKIKGVAHSFSDSSQNLKKALARDLMIGVNGISTFVKKPEELEMFAQIPLEKTILETDAPYLAPKGQRGRTNQPAFVELVAKDLSSKHKITREEAAKITTKNCEEFFGL